MKIKIFKRKRPKETKEPENKKRIKKEASQQKIDQNGMNGTSNLKEKEKEINSDFFRFFFNFFVRKLCPQNFCGFFFT